MKFKHLLVGVSPLALVMAFAVPGTATAQSGGQVNTNTQFNKDIDVDADVFWTNDVDVTLIKQVAVDKDLDIVGLIEISGFVEVDAYAQSLVDGKQFINDNDTQISIGSEVDNSISLGNAAVTEITGNVGVNVAQGLANAQANEVAISALLNDSGASGLEAEVFKFQEILGNHYDSFDASASNVFDAANMVELIEGNVGANIAQGAYNAQENALAIAYETSTSVDLAEATAAAYQEVAWNFSEFGSLVNRLTLDENIIRDIQGNVGLNFAQGVANAQVNALAISVVD
jgi:hypothetical protein